MFKVISVCYLAWAVVQFSAGKDELAMVNVACSLICIGISKVDEVMEKLKEEKK